MKGVLAGALGLLVLHALVARANQDQLQGLTGVATGFVTRFLDPTLPAIPDLADRGSVAGTITTSNEPVTVGAPVLAHGLLSGSQQIAPTGAYSPAAR